MVLVGYRYGLFLDGDHTMGGGGVLRARSVDAYMGIYGENKGVYGTPNSRVWGPKYDNANGIWALKPYHLGPWTFRVGLLLRNSK